MTRAGWETGGWSNAAGGSSSALPWAKRLAMAEGRRNPATADGDGDAMHLLIKGITDGSIGRWLPTAMATACPAPRRRPCRLALALLQC